jgi:branched-chain amino acid transport system permease protein
VFDKNWHSLPAFVSNEPIRLGGAALLPQSIVVLLGVGLVVVALWLFLTKTLYGKAMLATAANRVAAHLVGINTRVVVGLSFAISAAIGALGGILASPITLTNYDVGTMLALKGFAAAILGGMGNPVGAVAGGLLLGLLEAFAAGYISSQYKDAVAFIVILLVLFLMPQGLFASSKVERV